MRLRVSNRGTTRSLTHLSSWTLELVEAYYDGLSEHDLKEGLAEPPFLVSLRANHDRLTRVRARSGLRGVVDLNIQTAHDVAGLTRYFIHWENGARAALHDLLGIAAQIYGANAQWRAARGFCAYRRRAVQQGAFAACSLERETLPARPSYRVLGSHFLECVKAFLFFHEESHYWQELKPASADRDSEPDAWCDEYAVATIEKMSEMFDIDYALQYIDIVLFFTVLVVTLAEHAAYLLDSPVMRQRRLTTVLRRYSCVADGALTRHIVNKRRTPSRPEPYLASAITRAARWRPQMEQLLFEIEAAFAYVTGTAQVRKFTRFTRSAQFQVLLQEIEDSADREFERRKSDDAFFFGLT
jgi:hypothetical protein